MSKSSIGINNFGIAATISIWQTNNHCRVRKRSSGFNKSILIFLSTGHVPDNLYSLMEQAQLIEGRTG